ncbi:MAG: GNAT family N-acyltransferase [bacterium]
MIDVEAILDGLSPDFKNRKHLYKTTSALLKRLLHQDEINRFIDSHQHMEGLEFLDAVLDHFDFKYSISNRDRCNIPATGKAIIVANHPLGSLDGLTLLKMVSEIRPDVKIVATAMLSQVKPLENLFLSVDNITGKASQIAHMKKIVATLNQEQAVIIFPTGEVSRIRPQGVRDGKWKAGFVHLAYRTQASVIPVFIHGRNSMLFYSMSTLYKPLGTLMLVKEMFNKQDKEITFRVGKPIQAASMKAMDMKPKKVAKRMRKQVYRLAKNAKKPLFETIESIAHPANRKRIRDELKASELIGETADGKHIYLFDYRPNSAAIKEIGRLRELSFRQVEEGTGKALDIDDYDRYYRHLVLWDDNDLEIVGSYRIGEGKNILDEKGAAGFYSHTLFEFQPDMTPYLEKSIELGRSFIQPRYWGKRSLDYLWYGIGAYLQQHPEIKYMFGPLSLSAAYPDPAKQEIINFYDNLFGHSRQIVNPRLPYEYPHTERFAEYRKTTAVSDYKTAYSQLKGSLDEMGVRIPTLFKQYVEVCEPGGCEFLAFNIDPAFSNCIDALILVHIDKILPKKKDRYIHSHQSKIEQAA